MHGELCRRDWYVIRYAAAAVIYVMSIQNIYLHKYDLAQKF